MQIIVADSDEQALARLGALLGEVCPEAKVSLFQDPLFAIQYGLSHPVDLVFTEIMMVHTDGFAVLRAFRKKYPALRVFLMTQSDRYRERCLHSGADGCLRKPVDEGQLRAALGPPGPALC